MVGLALVQWIHKRGKRALCGRNVVKMNDCITLWWCQKMYVNMAEPREITNKINNVVWLDKTLTQTAQARFLKVAPFSYYVVYIRKLVIWRYKLANGLVLVNRGQINSTSCDQIEHLETATQMPTNYHHKSFFPKTRNWMPYHTTVAPSGALKHSRFTYKT